MFRNFVLFSALFLSVLASANASEITQIRSMSEAAAKLRHLAVSYETSEILVVFDIDNTLLTANQSLGGDAWYNWQENKLKTGDTQDLVAPDIVGLLDVQSKLFALGRMHPPEEGTPEFVKSLQDRGFDVMLETSRGIVNESATQRELGRSGYKPNRTAPGPQSGYAGRFIPYEIDQPEKSCLTKQEVTDWKLSASRPVIYREGVLMVEGQHKGALLRSLLCKINRSYKAILFIDDGQKNVDRLMQAYGKLPVELVALRYGYLDEMVSAFDHSDKRDVISAWEKLKAALEALL